MGADAISSGGGDEPTAGVVATTEWRHRDSAFVRVDAALAIEAPVALEYNGISHAVMLATPCDLEDFALGFSLSEGILSDAAELYQVDLRVDPPGITLALEVAAGAFAALKERRRTLAGRTGCGICGTESLEQVLRPLAKLADAVSSQQEEAGRMPITAVASSDTAGLSPGLG